MFVPDCILTIIAYLVVFTRYTYTLLIGNHVENKHSAFSAPSTCLVQ